MSLTTQSYFALFSIITLGFILGKIRIKGISLDISAVIFIALLFGHYGIKIPGDFQQLGLVLFIFTIGIQAGPGFFESFRKHGLKMIYLVIVLISSGAIISIVLAWAFDIDLKIISGLFTGAFTSTPGLAAAIDTTQSTLASIGYGIAYPFGVIGVILFVRIFPKIFGLSIKEAEKKHEKETLSAYPEIHSSNFIVENDNISGKSIGELKIRSMTGASISRVFHKDAAITPTSGTKLHKNDLVKAVGTQDALERIKLLIGSTTDQEIPLGKNYEVQSILVTNKDVVNKTLGQLNLLSNYHATITRIRRSGIDLSPKPGIHIQFGDKLMIAADKENMKQVARLFGNDDKRLSDTDFLPIALGIVLGILVGRISIVLSDEFTFSPGLTGGVLITALVLSKLGKTGPLVWTMTGAANQLLRQLGLLLFLASVGTSAGASLEATFSEYGFKLFYAGAVITLLPMLIDSFFSYYVLKMNQIGRAHV